jgi:hypothetical protein
MEEGTERRKLTLPSRYGYRHWLEEIQANCWLYRSDEKMPDAAGHGLHKGGRFFDPPGGPMIVEGFEVQFVDADPMWVAQISPGPGGMHFWLAETEEKMAELARATASMPTTMTASDATNIIYGEEKESATASSAKFSSFTQAAFESCHKYEYPGPLTIGMIGKAGSGKDTVADYLVSDYLFNKMALADPLKTAVQVIFAVDDELLYDREKREEELPDWPGWSVRRLLQFVGTELFRTHLDPDIWVKNIVLRAKKQRLSVISDVRFPNEIKMPRELLDHDVFFIKVVRPGINGSPSGIDGHESEAHDLEGDFTIVNDGTIEDLRNKVDAVMADIQRQAESR